MLHLVTNARLMQQIYLAACLSISGVWLYETHSGSIGEVDKLAYPLQIIIFCASALYIHRYPKALQQVVQFSYLVLNVYLLANYYYIFMWREWYGHSDVYQLSSLSLWLPMLYITSFLFLSERLAMSISWLNYLLVAVPPLVQHIGWPEHYSATAFGVLVNMLMAHPVYIIVVQGVARLKAAYARADGHARRMQSEAQYDPLTGLLNRRALLEQVARIESHTKRSGCYVLMLDIDHFKQVNDAYGHACGDTVLQAVAQALRQTLRHGDLLARWGGEEFVALVRVAPGDNCQAHAERLRMSVEALTIPGAPAVTLSIGSACFDQCSFATALQLADKALYTAKHNGRNRTEIFESQTCTQESASA